MGGVVMSWRVAGSLAELRQQLNRAHPDRSKASDGTIGDAAHAASVSDHNPDAAGVVRAFDITHDPKHGLDIAELAEQLRRARDPRIKYLICNRRIVAGNAGPKPWVWRDYHGTDPHTGHLHVSVVPGALGDDDRAWQIATPPKEEDDMTPEQATQLAEIWRRSDDTQKAAERAEYFATSNSKRLQATQAALAAIAETLPAETARQVTDALAADYDVELVVTKDGAP